MRQLFRVIAAAVAIIFAPVAASAVGPGSNPPTQQQLRGLADAPEGMPDVAPVVTITYSPGGSVFDFAQRVAQYAKAGSKVVVDGPCMSACTLVLTLPKMCATPNATFMFHQAYYAPSGEHRLDNIFNRADGTTKLLWSAYPAKVKAWINHYGGLTANMLFLHGDALKRAVPMCPASGSVTL